MQEVYILQDQNDLYLTKQGLWHNGSEANTLYRTPYKDEAINTRVEHSVKSPHLRIVIVSARCNEKGIPQVEVIAPIMQEPNIDDEPIEPTEHETLNTPQLAPETP